MDENLIKFLLKAKKATFASKTAKPKIKEDGGLEYVFSEGKIVYTDKYYGRLIDTGDERLWKENKLIWSMSYRGGMISNTELSGKCFSFLKKCLSLCPKEFPIRGPSIFEGKEFTYHNRHIGTIEGFIGEEKIFWKGNQIYFRNYLGGIIR